LIFNCLNVFGNEDENNRKNHEILLDE
jgi:hypothetical protein